MALKEICLVGLAIKDIRPMTPETLAHEGWEHHGSHSGGVEIILEDGSILYASADPEGNAPGALFGRKGDFTFAV